MSRCMCDPSHDIHICDENREWGLRKNKNTQTGVKPFCIYAAKKSAFNDCICLTRNFEYFYVWHPIKFARHKLHLRSLTKYSTQEKRRKNKKIKVPKPKN